MRILTVLAVLATACLANFALWSLPNRPVPLESPPGGVLKSISFAPFRPGQSPLTFVYPTPAEIDEDMAVLAGRVESVRVYSSKGFESVPDSARRHGLKVTMGAWLSGKAELEEQEIALVIELANRYPDVITRVVVGNEALLRRDTTPEKLTGYLRQVRAAVHQPVTYADVWEWWLKYPQIAAEVDFLTIHLLPYWEDVPAGVAGATERIRWSYREIARQFPDKPILVGEVGWPTAGRSRGAAVPGVVENALFVSSFVRLAAEEGFDYNLIEAFDQPWKEYQEGTVGGHWGLYTAGRVAKYPADGPVVENPGWPRQWALSTAAGLAGFGLLALSGPPLAAGGLMATALLTQGLASGLTHAVAQAMALAHAPLDVARAGLLVGLQALLAASILAAAGGPPTAPWRRLGTASVRTLAGFAVVWSLLIVVKGRYRDFPNADMLIPAFGLLALGAVRAMGRATGRPAGGSIPGALAIGTLFGCPGDRPPVHTALAWGLVLGAVGTVVAEGVVPLESLLNGQGHITAIDWSQPNLEALAWAGLQLLLAVPFAARPFPAKTPVTA
jgi:exo-beta-1,3-glucanase (GH17 family)